jgi:hypothetical protein
MTVIVVVAMGVDVCLLTVSVVCSRKACSRKINRLLLRL